MSPRADGEGLVPERDIFMDHAGFDTWDSVQRARKVFGVDSALVVTQGFHMPRALWLARLGGGWKADGVVGGPPGHGTISSRYSRAASSSRA